MKKKVWTYRNSPFIMGGNVHSIISTDVEVESEKKVRGVKIFSFKTLKGNIRVAESTTGAIVGDDLIEVGFDIVRSDLKTIKLQLEEANKDLLRLENNHLSYVEFFKIYEP